MQGQFHQVKIVPELWDDGNKTFRAFKDNPGNPLSPLTLLLTHFLTPTPLTATQQTIDLKQLKAQLPEKAFAAE